MPTSPSPASLRRRAWHRPRSTARRTARPTIVTAALAAVVLLAAACGQPTQPSQSAAGPAGASETSSETAGSFPVSVEHKFGTTDIAAEPQRIVALGYTELDYVLALGYAPVAARYPQFGDTDTAVRPWAHEAAAGADPEVLNFAFGELGFEEIAALEPDLILADIRHADLYDQLSSIAPTVFSETTGPTWKDNIELFAEATGTEDAADAALTAYEERATAIGAEVNAAASDPEVSILRFSGEGTARLYQSGNFSGIVLADAGLARPENQRPAEFNLDLSEEQLLQADADVVVVSSYAQDTAAADRARFEANPLWGRLTGRVVEVDDNRWMLPVSLQGAHLILDDLAEAFDVDPATPAR